MKKTIISLAVLFLVATLVLGVTQSYLKDTEITDSTVSAGTFDISDEGSWTKSFSVIGLYPGKDAEEINFDLKNIGSKPMRVWMTIKNVSSDENSISEPEQDWYDANGGAKNDVDSALVYALSVDGNLVLEQEAGITVEQIKDYYVGLVKLDPGIVPPSYGILESGEAINISQKFYLPLETENWAQSDIMNFEIEIVSQQVEAPEPIKQLSFMQDKYDAGFETDGTVGVLKYDSAAEYFNYNFIAKGLNPSTEYDLIYYADDWPGNNPGYAFAHGYPDSEGVLEFSGSEDLSMNLPATTDYNFDYGAKIWLVKSGYYNRIAKSVISWTPSGWLLENWPGFINYTQSTDGVSTSTETVTLTSLGTTDQFGYYHDYGTANVNFSYDTPAIDRLSGTMTATGLKPYATYQVKFVGQPTCDNPSGDDVTNEKIGYKGRWTCVDCVCSGADCNRTDAQYTANKSLPDTDSSKECIAGYLAWGYVTADAGGNLTKDITTDCSYHVLWCSGGMCGSANNGQLITSVDSSFHGFPTCESDDVNGEIERFTCGGLSLDVGVYDLDLVLTEESFHQSTYGTWTTVMGNEINFEIE